MVINIPIDKLSVVLTNRAPIDSAVLETNYEDQKSNKNKTKHVQTYPPKVHEKPIDI